MADARIDDLNDLSTFPPGGGIGFTDIVIRGARVPLEHVARAWLTTAGGLVWAPGAVTLDINELENSDPRATELETWRARFETAARQVDYVASARVTLTLGDVLVVSGEIILVDGQRYRLGVTIDEAGGAILNLPPEVA